MFDEEYAKVDAGRTFHELFDRVMGPFPAEVQPFSLVTREGLDRVLMELDLEPDDHLLDLCCGRGGIGLWFARETGARLTGIDFSPTAVEQARRRAELFVPEGRARFLVADASATTLERQAFDAVVCIDAVQMLPDRPAGLREAGALLRRGGRLVFTTWEIDESPAGRTPLPDAGRLVEEAGLQLLLREEHPEWLERQNELYKRAIAADGEDAEPAMRDLAEEARAFLPRMAAARRVLVVATTDPG
jgi:ubiquinone/menaquinone biosynthesis C-methylase UbiE